MRGIAAHGLHPFPAATLCVWVDPTPSACALLNSGNRIRYREAIGRNDAATIADPFFAAMWNFGKFLIAATDIRGRFCCAAQLPGRRFALRIGTIARWFFSGCLLLPFLDVLVGVIGWVVVARPAPLLLGRLGRRGLLRLGWGLLRLLSKR